MQTRAAILWGKGEDWSVEEIELDPPRAGEVLVKLVGTGLCHSDEHIRTGDLALPPDTATMLGIEQYPQIGGHEGAGEIVDIGPGVSSLAPGDHVVLSFMPVCGRCPSCARGRSDLCDLGAFLLAGRQPTDFTARHHAGDGRDLGIACMLGTFGEYTVVSEASAIKIEPDIPLDKACLVGCGVTTGWGSSVYAADVQPGETVVIFGVGGVGMNAVQGAAMVGARHVVAVDPVDHKRETAQLFGATHTAATVEEAAELVGEITWGRLADKCIITIGVGDVDLIAPVLAMTAKGGRVVHTAVAPLAAQMVPLNLTDLTSSQKELVGTVFGSANPRYDIPRLLRLYQEGRLKLDELVTNEYQLDDINQGYADMYNGTNIRGSSSGTEMITQTGILRGDEFLTTAELDERSRRGATAITSIDVADGDTVALLLRNDHAFFEAAMAVATVGAAPVPVNWHGTADEILHVIDDSHAKLLVAHADLLRPLIGSLPEDLEVRVVATPSDIAETYGVTEHERVVPSGMTEWLSWIQRFEPWTEAPRGRPPRVLYTSGTTGKPKGVRRPSIDEARRQQSSYYAELATASGFEPGIRAVVTGPLYHGAPFAWGLGWARMRGLVVLQPRFDAEDLLRTIEEQSITHLLLVPIMFTRLLKLPAEVRDRYDVSSLRYVSHGAAPCPRHVKQQMIEWWGPVIHELYGSAEIGVVTWATADEWLAHPGTVGRPIAGAEVRILDEDGNELATGEIGEIYTRVADLPQFSYEGHTEAAAEIARDGFLSGGDIGYVDDDGFLHLCDRKKDMVISGGVNVYPIEIESCLFSLVGVRDVAVFGVPDDEYGESLCAAVELDGTRSLTADDVRNHVRAHLAAFKAPRIVEFHDELPREDSGKVFKRKLRDAYWADAGRTI